MTESQQRFVRAVLERLPADRVAELHLFPALRQGAAETGMAVIAARRTDEARADAPDRHPLDTSSPGSALADVAPPDEVPEPEPLPASGHRRRPARRTAQEPGERHTVFTARYRLTIRGAERGRWEFDLVEEADAPLVTVDAVVRGVQERAGEGGEPERLGPDALAALAGAPWTIAAR